MNLNDIPDLLTIGLVFMIGWGAHVLGSRAHIPRITLLLITGVIAGPSGLDVVPEQIMHYSPMISHLALAMVGFLLGESFVGKHFQKEKNQILAISFGASFIPGLLVFLITWAISQDVVIALVLGGIATATDPAATLDVIKETHAKGPLTRMIKNVVAIDDAWGVILFSLSLVLAKLFSGNGTSLHEMLLSFWEVIGGLLLGITIGIPMSKVIGKHKPGEPTLIEAMGFVFICGGLALYLELSYLLSCMALGATVARTAKHVSRPFHEIEAASEPFLIIFFLLSGLSLDLLTLDSVGLILLVYILVRSLGKIAGAHIMARNTGSKPAVYKHIGWCLLPQAGVAIGMALLVAERLPEIGDTVLSLTIASTIIFELFGPIITQRHLNKAQETVRHARQELHD